MTHSTHPSPPNIPTSPNTRWVNLDEASAVSSEGLHPYEIPYTSLAPSSPLEGSLNLLVVHHEGALYALHDECPHRRIKLSEQGYAEGEWVVCGWHGWRFKLETGEHMIPTGNCVQTYPVALHHERLWVALPISF